VTGSASSCKPRLPVAALGFTMAGRALVIVIAGVLGCRGEPPVAAPPPTPPPRPAAALPDGVWRAHRSFGPTARGRLEIIRSQGAWLARIAGFEQPVALDGDHLKLELPGAHGRFVGRFGPGAVIRGVWIQPPTVNSGNELASRIILHPLGADHWAGDVMPVEDTFTLYLVTTRAPDGSLKAFLRNPDRNIGVVWAVDHVQQTGDRIERTPGFVWRYLTAGHLASGPGRDLGYDAACAARWS
jgi:hypothetical protein